MNSSSSLTPHASSRLVSSQASLLLCALCVLCGEHSGRGAEPQVDRGEVIRWGDTVQHVAGDERQASDMGDVFGTPPDDNHKWFISVVGQKGCAPCARLRADIAADQAAQKHLGAFVQLMEADSTKSDTQKSWSHFNYFLADDKSQAFRFENLKIRAYPAILVQPPLNKKYGDPSTVVFKREGYDGDPNKLVKDLSAAIKLYVAKQNERKAAATPAKRGGFRRQQWRGDRSQESGVRSQNTGPVRQLDPRPSSLDPAEIGQAPPWTPAPKVEPLPAPSPSPDLNLPLDIPPRIVPRPAEDAPAPSDASNQKIPASPEALVVVDGSALDGETQDRLRPVIDRLKRDRPGLRVRLIDVRDAKHLPVRREELPAVVTTADGRVEDKIGGRLLDLFAPKPPAVAPQQPTNVVVPPFPFEQWLAALASGGSVGAIITAVIGTLAWIRARRRANGQAVMAPGIALEQLAPVIESIIARVVAAIQSKPPADKT